MTDTSQTIVVNTNGAPPIPQIPQIPKIPNIPSIPGVPGVPGIGKGGPAPPKIALPDFDKINKAKQAALQAANNVKVETKTQTNEERLAEIQKSMSNLQKAKDIQPPKEEKPSMMDELKMKLAKRRTNVENFEAPAEEEVKVIKEEGKLYNNII